MDKIIVGIYDEHNLVQQGISALIGDLEDIKLTLMCSEKSQLDEALKASSLHVLIINMYEMTTSVLNHITQLCIRYPRMKILIISILGSEEVILKKIGRAHV
jgi:DNA-binding NarL/FixJ family response regulator